MTKLKMNQSQRISVIIFVILMAALFFSAQAAYAEEATPPAPVLKETKVVGLVTQKTLHVKSKMQDTIALSPAYGRTVELQRYNTSSKKWEVKKKYKTHNVRSDKVTMVYPSSLWNKAKYTKWRIYLPVSKKGTAYRSKAITITTKNRSRLKLSCKSAVIINSKTGVVLYDKGMNRRRAQASITKVMTAIISLERKSLSTPMTISAKAQNTPYPSIPLKKGDKLYFKQLLYSALLPSDNGSTVAIAENTSGSTSKFVKLMNQKAKKLGCKNTRYANTHGLDSKGHYSTAYDTALIVRSAMKNSTFRKIVKTKKYSFTSLKNKRHYTVESTNDLLGKVSGICGAKTGTTGNAGSCFAGIYKYKGQTYITVVLGSGQNPARWKDTITLLKYTKKYGW